MQEERVILTEKRIKLTLDRLCHQIIENHNGFDNSCLIGVQPRGVKFAERIHQNLQRILGRNDLAYGKLDVTFYRDDFRRRSTPLVASDTEIDFLVEDKNVILIDDVLYSGRTIRAALDALQHYGRPSRVELLVLVERRFNRQLPIQPDYLGVSVDAVEGAYVKVELKGEYEEDRILFYPKNKNES